MNELSLYVIKMIFSAEIWLIFLFLNMAFLVLYFSVTTSVYRISNWLLKNRRIYQIEKGSTFDGQIKFEIIHSLYSILIFALYGVITILLLRAEVLEIANNRGWTIVLHLVILGVWNEFHFYICHRLMHSKKLVNFHRIHHKSVIVTPFSTYSFHPLEAFILGSVMILPMTVFSIEMWALILLPVYSLLLNAIGHSNVTLFKMKEENRFRGMSKRHNKHHTKFNSNFGFGTSLLDFVLKTEFKLKKKT